MPEDAFDFSLLSFYAIIRSAKDDEYFPYSASLHFFEPCHVAFCIRWNTLKLPIAAVDKTWQQAYIRPRYRECFGMLIAKLDNIGFAVLLRGLFNN
jgi:hypothetical protein